MEAIFSKSNENVKYIKSLNEKKYRTLYSTFYIEGVKVVTEILDKKKAIDIEFIAYSKSMLSSVNGGNELLEKIEKSNIRKIEFTEDIFRYMTDTVNSQGVLIVLKIPKLTVKELIKNNNDKNILILDKVQDLGNIGTIIRSANAFDIKLILCTFGTADVYAPKAIRATMGGILNVDIAYINNLAEIDILKANGYKLVVSSLEAKEDVKILKSTEKYAIVVGNEANGVSNEIYNKADLLVKIPMTDKVESLNVGVATSIILYEQYKKLNQKD